MEGTSRILSVGICVCDVGLPRDLLSDAKDLMGCANGRSSRGWNESKRGEMDAEGDKCQGENPKNGSHRLDLMAAGVVSVRAVGICSGRYPRRLAGQAETAQAKSFRSRVKFPARAQRQRRIQIDT